MSRTLRHLPGSAAAPAASLAFSWRCSCRPRSDASSAIELRGSLPYHAALHEIGIIRPRMPRHARAPRLRFMWGEAHLLAGGHKDHGPGTQVLLDKGPQQVQLFGQLAHHVRLQADSQKSEAARAWSLESHLAASGWSAVQAVSSMSPRPSLLHFMRADSGCWLPCQDTRGTNMYPNRAPARQETSARWFRQGRGSLPV